MKNKFEDSNLRTTVAYKNSKVFSVPVEKSTRNPRSLYCSMEHKRKDISFYRHCLTVSQIFFICYKPRIFRTNFVQTKIFVSPYRIRRHTEFISCCWTIFHLKKMKPPPKKPTLFENYLQNFVNGFMALFVLISVGLTRSAVSSQDIMKRRMEATMMRIEAGSRIVSLTKMW